MKILIEVLIETDLSPELKELGEGALDFLRSEFIESMEGLAPGAVELRSIKKCSVMPTGSLVFWKD